MAKSRERVFTPTDLDLEAGRAARHLSNRMKWFATMWGPYLTVQVRSILRRFHGNVFLPTYTPGSCTSELPPEG